MFELTVKEILNTVKGSLITGDEDVSVKGISTDSRTIKQGEIFFALIGPNFDGNRFVEDVFKKGAGAAVVGKSFDPRPMTHDPRPIISVDDTLVAFGEIARYWRSRHPLPLIAVSGSCGKTTTKEMIASILARSHSVLKTEGNLNNLIGLPHTLFRINNLHDVAVVELGVSEGGEMKRLAEICKPDIAVLTNIRETHLKTFKTIEGVAYQKAEIFSGLKDDGVAIINNDDPWILKIGESLKQRKFTFGLKSKADVSLMDYSEGDRGVSAIFTVNKADLKIRINSIGAHNLLNAGAAIASSVAIGVSNDDIINGLKDFKPLHGRLERIDLKYRITVINDTYNANPASVESALKSLAEIKGRRIAVLGDMLELGGESETLHRDIGRVASRIGLDLLFTVGEFAGCVADGAIKGGMDKRHVIVAIDKREVVDALIRVLKKGDVVLVKGSRAVGMEEIVEKLAIIKGAEA